MKIYVKSNMGSKRANPLWTAYLYFLYVKTINSGDKIYAAFIDNKRCFNSIERNHVWFKLISENIHNCMATALRALGGGRGLCQRGGG